MVKLENRPRNGAEGEGPGGGGGPAPSLLPMSALREERWS